MHAPHAAAAAEGEAVAASATHAADPHLQLLLRERDGRNRSVARNNHDRLAARHGGGRDGGLALGEGICAATGAEWGKQERSEWPSRPRSQ
eukprot:4309451-Prymnesium_polylepis.1